MIFSLVLAFLFSAEPTVYFYGISIPILKEQTEWAKSSRNIDFLEENYIDQSQQIISQINSAGNFNDWQKVQLAIKFSKSLFPDNKEKSVSMTFYLWIEMNFEVLPGYNKENEMIPLIACDQSLFGIPFFKIKGQRYYDLLQLTKASELEKKGLTIHSDDPPPKGNQKLFIDISWLPAVGNQIQTKNLSWTFENFSYSYDIPINVFLRSYYHDLPNLDYGYLLNYQFSKEILENLIAPLRDDFRKQALKDNQRAECLRQMILQCFPYIDDLALFGYEHIQFPEELLLSEGCDCEDRSLFLIKLIEELTDLTPLMADYPTHVSVLINSDSGWKGDAFEYKGQNFIFCDPTFFNAPLGAVPEAIKDLTPDIIERKQETEIIHQR